jgi:(p)ppGpp synthase/HD superfamily hydrolase
MLSKAIIIATNAHNGQIDKAGKPYIFHPLHIMLQMDDEDSRIVAVLHDVVEDTLVTLDVLKYEGFNQNIIDAIDCITRKQNEDYFDYIRRVKTNELAKLVKLFDLEHNTKLSRLKKITHKDVERNYKYFKAITLIYVITFF